MEYCKSLKFIIETIKEEIKKKWMDKKNVCIFIFRKKKVITDVVHRVEQVTQYRQHLCQYQDEEDQQPCISGKDFV